MYCADFTAVYDKTNFPNKLLFAGKKYDRYINNNFHDKIYIKKFYMNKNNEICFKYLKFGKTTEEKGYYNSLVYEKKKTYKLTNFKSIRDFIRERNIKLK